MDWGMDISFKNRPVYDPGFVPIAAFRRAYAKEATEPFALAIERPDGLTVKREFLLGRGCSKIDCFYASGLVKTMLWSIGGHSVTVCGGAPVFDTLAREYSKEGARAYDVSFMEHVFERPFEICWREYDKSPAEVKRSAALGNHWEGCRIGLDLGGSMIKVSAVTDGKTIYSEAMPWDPKENADPAYHGRRIREALQKAAEKMPRVDAIGISSAGVFIGGRAMVSSLFMKVPENEFDRQGKDIFRRIAKEMGNVPLVVMNDGDVAALAGAASLGANRLLGISMGTSEAAGYADEDGKITGWLNELAFVPIDTGMGAAIDEWSGDRGCGVKYLSQDGVLKLARAAGIDLSVGKTFREKCALVQKLAADGHTAAMQVFDDIGCYLAHALACYSEIYSIDYVLLMGGVTGGVCGEIIQNRAKQVLQDEYPDCGIQVCLPGGQFRRTGQSVTAAGLPEGR